MPLEQIHLVEKVFTWPTSDSLEDEWKYCNEAVKTSTLYCGFLEGGPLRGRPKRSAPLLDHEDQQVCPATPKREKRERPTVSAWEEKLGVTKKHIEDAPQPRACFQCLKEYFDHNGVKRHFKKSHLTDRKCNYCDVSIQHEVHL
jgi:hypothetical protein